MGALEEVAALANLPKLVIPIERLRTIDLGSPQEGARLRIEQMVLASQNMTTAVLSRTYVPDWARDVEKQYEALESQKVVLDQVRQRADVVIEAARRGELNVALTNAIVIPVHALNDLIWVGYLSAQYGMVPLARVMTQRGATSGLDEEFLHRTGIMQAVTAVAQSPFANALEQERNRRLGISGLGIGPAAIAAIVVGGVAIIAALAFLLAYGYSVMKFNDRWKAVCTDPRMLEDPEMKQWCIKTGAPPPAINPTEWVTYALWLTAVGVGGYFAIVHLPDIIRGLKGGARAVRET